jgi:hypothetical protein
VYLGWAYLWWSPIPGSGTSVWTGRNLILFLVGGASPLLAGVSLAWLTGGAARVRDLGRRLVDVRRISATWWLIILAFWPVFNLVMAGAAMLLGVTDRPFDVALDVLTDPGTLAFQLTLAFVFPAVEEVGLRGYWLDRLHERFSITVAGPDQRWDVGAVARAVRGVPRLLREHDVRPGPVVVAAVDRARHAAVRVGLHQGRTAASSRSWCSTD